MAQTFSIEFNGFGWQTVYPECWSEYSGTFDTVEHAAADLLQVVGEIGEAANKPQQGVEEWEASASALLSKPPLCGICSKLMNTGAVEDEDCGGDCLECMGTAGHPEAAKSFLKEVRELRTVLTTLGVNPINQRATK
jgi:hypothetical protein